MKILIIIVFLIGLDLWAQDTKWKEVSSSGNLVLGISNDDIAYYWGNTNHRFNSSTPIPESLTPQLQPEHKWIKNDGLYSTYIFLEMNGTLWAYGINQFGEFGDGTTKGTVHNIPIQIGIDNDWVNFFLVKIGDYNHPIIYAVKKNGSLWAWGINTGYFGDESIPISVSSQKPYTPTQIGIDSNWSFITNQGNAILALKNDGSLWAWGQSLFLGIGDAYKNIIQKSPIKIGKEKWKMINVDKTATISRFAAIREDGTLWVFGERPELHFGYRDDLGPTYNMMPRQYGKENTWQQICFGDGYFLALKTDGTLWGEGSNIHGAIGNGSKDAVRKLTKIGSDSDWVKVFVFWNNSFAIKKDGSLWSWGENWAGQLGIGNKFDQFSPVKVK
jgi:alpha-tubulin suppressor-like RCC1 family protein